MDNTHINQTQVEVEQALSEKKLKTAFSILSNIITEYHKGNLGDELYNIEYTYKSMLKYMIEGANDPQRQSVYNNILLTCYNLSDKLYSSVKENISTSLYYETKRNSKQNLNKSIFLLGNEVYSENTTNRILDNADIKSPQNSTAIFHLFNRLWIDNAITNEDATYLKKLLIDENIHFSIRCIFVSAITIGLIQEFCLNKLLLLFDILSIEEEKIRQRAITGLLLVLYKYDNRINLYPEITARLTLLQEDTKTIKNIVAITIQLIRTLETEKISTKLNEEIIPEVVKMQPTLRNKLDLDNLLGDNLTEDENPEWEDFFKDSPDLLNKLEELTELQMEGSDVFLSTFKMLKHFSFFNTLYNWFMPFHIENEEIKNITNQDSGIFSNSKIQESMANSGFLCNSDKYSLFLSIPHMPDFQKDLMSKMLEQQLDQMDEIEKDEKLTQPGKKEAIISNRYIQDLYRFFKLHPKHNLFEDIFAWQMDFHNKFFFKQIIKDNNQFRQIGEFFFKKEYYKEAAEIFSLLEQKEPNHLEMVQKTAYCKQNLNEYTKALNLYLKADIIKPNQIWTTKKIALMYKHLKKPNKALEYYLLAEKLKPEDLHTQAAIGHCYFELKNYKEALKYYFKVEYLDETNTKVWHPIGWCSFATGNIEQAEKYYNKILHSSSKKHDYINMGHILWCKNNPKEALEHYKKAIELMDNNMKEFLDTIKEDKSLLIKNGINNEDIPMVIDQLRYSLED